VTVHAEGRLAATGKVFWNSKEGGDAFRYKAGVGAVIKGWDAGCLGMERGEVRRLEIPCAEGYGANGFKAFNIPAHSDLTFTIECLAIS